MGSHQKLSVEFEGTCVHLWVCCLCVVRFDVDKGHTLIESTYTHPYIDSPLTYYELYQLTPKLSLPDYNSTNNNNNNNNNNIHDIIYCYRLRRETSLPLRGDTIESLSYLFGYVYFRREKDNNNPRVYEQTSVVLLSPLPFVGLFERAVASVGKKYFEEGIESLREALVHMSKWPIPRCLESLSLKLFGVFVFVCVCMCVSMCPFLKLCFNYIHIVQH
eukprot:GHVR01110393.1.p1 GENE.GHVR01110393.1~~GHVR01110393.1.p1  ORF type:complete len:218 (+),score=54.39 GHVR01110393.1:90-743(+)